MKILIFSLAYDPFVGGAEVAIKEITDRLGADFSFDMLTVNLDGQQPAQEKIGNINVYRLGHSKLSKYLFPWTAYRYAKKIQRENGYDAIWAMMANQAGWAALKFKKKFPQVKYLLTLQEGDSEWDIWWRTFLIRPLYKNIYRRADYIQAISKFLAKRAENLGAKCLMEVVPNAADLVDQEFLDNALKAGEIAKGAEKRVITASRLVEKNGIADLIKSMRHVDAKLIIAGDGQLSLKLKRLVKELQLENKVDFIGEINRFDLAIKLKSSDVFVRPSLSEGLGNAFLEAMSCEVPVIGTPVGGIPDFLTDGETGWFCEVKNPKSIAEKINYILDPKNKEIVDQVIARAKKMVDENYSWNLIATKMKNIFLKLK